MAVRLAAEDVSSFDKDAPKTPLVMKEGNKVVLSVCNHEEDQKNMVVTSEFFPVVNCDSLCEIVSAVTRFSSGIIYYRVGNVVSVFNRR